MSQEIISELETHKCCFAGLSRENVSRSQTEVHMKTKQKCVQMGRSRLIDWRELALLGSQQGREKSLDSIPGSSKHTPFLEADELLMRIYRCSLQSLKTLKSFAHCASQNNERRNPIFGLLSVL